MADTEPLTIATLESVHRPANGNPCSTMLFNMRTNNDLHPIDLKTILKCIKHAEQQETIPALPFQWWVTIWSTYGDF